MKYLNIFARRIGNKVSFLFVTLANILLPTEQALRQVIRQTLNPRSKTFTSCVLVLSLGGGVLPALALELSDTDGSNGFVINGIQGHVFDAFGSSVSNAGDINNDGIQDIIVGDPQADPTGYNSIGESYVIFGSKTDFRDNLDISNLDGINGFFINGLTSYESFGASVSNAGDVNADGIDDIIIGAPIASPNGKYLAGKAYVVFGSDTPFNANLDVTMLDGTNGFIINGVEINDQFGRSVSGGGDFNGDDIDDVVIGAPTGFISGVSKEGKSYVIFGTREDFTPSMELDALDGSNGFVINGIDPVDHTGYSVSNAGDVNADGIDDIIIGAPLASTYAGRSYIVFGSTSGFDGRFDLSDLDGSNGFAINGNSDLSSYLGYSVRNAGDVNADGADDVIIGSPTGGGAQAM